MEIVYKSIFIRQFNKLPKSLQEEVLEKIELIRVIPDSQKLKVHKLKGTLKGCYSFSVNYKYRIVFTYETKNEIVLLAIGDHDVYQ